MGRLALPLHGRDAAAREVRGVAEGQLAALQAAVRRCVLEEDRGSADAACRRRLRMVLGAYGEGQGLSQVAS